jgi:hypothetical protein
MRALITTALVVCGVTGCATTVQPGLANAQAIPGESPETRVHDVIANGRDACERWMFPQAEVLRGHVPPCSHEGTASPRVATRGL